jgi:hypothetical protein
VVDLNSDCQLSSLKYNLSSDLKKQNKKNNPKSGNNIIIMAPAPTIHMKGPPSKQILPVAVFPDSLPHRKESFFLSIVIGQTHLHWAMHEGFDAECTASVFWK